MTCRVARSFQDHTHKALVSRSEYGATNLEMCSTSETLGAHLRPIGAQSMVGCGVAKDSKTQLSNVTADEGVERTRFGAPNVGASLVDSNVNDMAAQIRRRPLPDWRRVLQTTIELLVVGAVILLVLLWLMMFLLWSLTIHLSIKIWRQRNLFRYGLLLIGSGVRTSNEPRKSRLFWF
jgi:hypothetical protein